MNSHEDEPDDTGLTLWHTYLVHSCLAATQEEAIELVRRWMGHPREGMSRCYEIDVFDQEQLLPNTWVLCVNDQGEQIGLYREEQWPDLHIQRRRVAG